MSNDREQIVVDDERKRRHLPAAERERLIVDGAVKFFAEHGFDGQTRELAKTMGISHSAIFRYFPSKDALIERVYEHVFLSRWDEQWNALIVDRTQPLEARLLQFYTAYADRIFEPDWVRIFVSSGLKGYAIAPRYMDLVRTQIILALCGELRNELGLPSADAVAITSQEEESFWGLHGMIFYLAIRKFVYGSPAPADPRPIIAEHVRLFMRGAPTLARTYCTGARTA